MDETTICSSEFSGTENNNKSNIRIVNWRTERGLFLYDDRESEENIKYNEYCKKEFEKHGGSYRDDGTRTGYYKTKCISCGKEIYTSHAFKNTCSQRCKNDIYLKRRRERREEQRLKICPICKKEFKSKRKDTIYCSSKCKQSGYRIKKVTDICSGNITSTDISNK